MSHLNQIDWPHAPVHRLDQAGIYIVTAGTYQKEHFFTGKDRLQALHDGLLKYAKLHGWTLEAWAIFPNHYHFIGHSPVSESGPTCLLKPFLASLHQHSASWVNTLDNTKNRKVWHNFWETRLTHERSYLARLNYVHQNAVKHNLVKVASHYPWCSASWFERTCPAAKVKTIYSFKTDKVNVLDDY